MNKYLIATLLLGVARLCSADAISVQSLALAPNAGGQESYALRYFSKNYEYSAFSTFYLTSNGQPLSGVTTSYRFDACKRACWAQAFIQPGVGFSQIGPHIELTWGFILGWAVRVDLTTQLFISQNRILTWSYPLWTGISVPF